MSSSFQTAGRWLFSSESVTEGHPDKLCDQVSDAVLDALLAKDPMSRVACETATTTGTVLVAGEITTTAYADVIGIVRDVVKDIGYTNAHYGFDYETCGVLTAIKPQSPDIARGVDRAQDDGDELGAGDQGMMFGFAVDETPELMPLPITLAHVVAKQHDEDVDVARLRRDVRDAVVGAAIPADLLDGDTRYVINGTGKFVIGGPMGDAGLTGRKIIVDTYGGYAPHGGGAFSGKDATKVDRSGAYAARYVAKNIVAAGLAKRCQIQIAYVIGVAKPVSLNVETFCTRTVDDDVIRRLIDEHFDFRPQEIIARFDLRRPIFRQTAAYGHFGRPDLDLPWERTDLAETFARSAGSRRAAV